MNRKTHWLLVVAVIVSLGLVSVHSADARGWGKGPGGGNGCNNYGQADQLDEKTIAARDKFRQENQELFKQLVTKKAELRAVFNQDNPDSDKAAQLSGELFELRNALHKKADESGLPRPRALKAGCDGTGGQGQGFGGGRHGRGMGPRAVWN
jgi:Spy/CpxP family protein refolding chaperone